MSNTPLLTDVQILLTQEDYEAILHLASREGWTTPQAVSAIIRGWAIQYRLSLEGS